MAESRLRAHRLDLALGAFGTLLGWVSLLFPFGRDQGLYFYVAREWVERGAIPYRDVLDHKTPGIYVLHAIAIRVFGAHMWGIRVLDAIAVLAIGMVASTFTAARGEAPAPGVRGATILATNVLFYGFLDFWNTAQSEVWYSLLGLAAIASARRVERDTRSAWVAGAFAASAMVMKPPAIWFVLIAAACVVHRAWTPTDGRVKRAALQLARFGGASAIVFAIVLGYFGAHGALHAMTDIVVGANAYYVQHETNIHTLHDVLAESWSFLHFYNPVASGLLIALASFAAHAVGSGDRAALRRLAFAAVLLAGAFLAVAMQKKFYLLHWIVFIAPAAVLCANLAERARTLFPRANVFAFVLALVGLFAISDGAKAYMDETTESVAYLTGHISRDAFAHSFALDVIGFRYGDSEAVGLWIRDHSSPDDLIAVRGFEPEIYAVAERRYPGRFFWTTFLTSPVRAYHRTEWLAEDAAALAAHPPRYVVTLTAIHEGIDSSEFFTPRGYVERFRANDLAVLELAR